MIGLFEAVCAPWKVDGVPDDFSFGDAAARLGPDGALPRDGDGARPGVARRSASGSSSAARRASRPTSQPVVGEAPEVRNYFVAAGLNSIGILTGGGLGRVLAHWIVDGRPDVDVTGMNIDRLHTLPGQPRVPRDAHGRVARHGLPVPLPDPVDADGARREALRRCTTGSPRAARTSATSAAGRAPTGTPRRGSEPTVDRLLVGPPALVRLMGGRAPRRARGRHRAWTCRSCRSSSCRAATPGRLLDRLSANHVDGEAGAHHLHAVAQRGRHAGGRPHRHQARRRPVLGRRLRHRPPPRRDVDAPARRPTLHAFVTDVTSGFAQLNVQGPRSRELLQSLTSADLSNEAFPFRTAREIDIGFARVLCVRITYLGELGYELYIPAEQATHVYDRLVAAGAAFGLRHAGLKALAQPAHGEGLPRLRPRHRQHRLGARGRARLRRRPRQAGGFIGREAVVAQEGRGSADAPARAGAASPTPSRCCSTPSWCCRDGKPVGYVRAASYGHTLGGAVGLAMVGEDDPVDKAWLEGARWEVDIAGTPLPGHRRRCARCTTRPTARSRPDGRTVAGCRP